MVRCRHSSVSGFPRSCLNIRIPCASKGGHFQNEAGDSGVEGTNEELLETIEHFHGDDASLRRIASAGRAWSFEHFSSEAIAQFMVESTMNVPFSKEYVRADEAYRSPG